MSTTKVAAPVVGFNHNLKHAGRIFHVQTEDSGLPRAHFLTHLYIGGNILASMKGSYADRSEEPELPQIVRKMMEEQHKNMVRRLVAGEFTEKAAQLSQKHYEPGVLADGHTGPAAVNVENAAVNDAAAVARLPQPPAETIARLTTLDEAFAAAAAFAPPPPPPVGPVSKIPIPPPFVHTPVAPRAAQKAPVPPPPPPSSDPTLAQYPAPPVMPPSAPAEIEAAPSIAPQAPAWKPAAMPPPPPPITDPSMPVYRPPERPPEFPALSYTPPLPNARKSPSAPGAFAASPGVQRTPPPPAAVPPPPPPAVVSAAPTIEVRLATPPPELLKPVPPPQRRPPPNIPRPGPLPKPPTIPESFETFEDEHERLIAELDVPLIELDVTELDPSIHAPARTPGAPLPSVTRAPPGLSRTIAPPRLTPQKPPQVAPPQAAPAQIAPPKMAPPKMVPTLVPQKPPPSIPAKAEIPMSIFATEDRPLQTPDEAIPTLFAEELISERSLDEVILAFLSSGDGDKPK